MNMEATSVKRYGKDAAYLLAYLQQAKRERVKGALRFSISKLERDCGLSRYLLKRTLQVLESEGLIHIKRLTQKSSMEIELLD